MSLLYIKIGQSYRFLFQPIVQQLLVHPRMYIHIHI